MNLQQVSGMFKLSFSSIALFFICSLFFASFVFPSIIMDRFIVGPEVWFYVNMSALMAIVACSLFIYDIPNLRPINRIDILLLVILGYITLARFRAGQISLNDKTLLFVCLTSLYFITKFLFSSIGNTRQSVINMITITIFLVSTISCCFGLIQLYHIVPSFNPNFRITGQFQNPARYGEILAALVPFSLATYLYFPRDQKNSKPIRRVAAFVGLLSILIIPATFSRSAWIGIGFAVLFILGLKYFHIIKPFFKKKYYLAGAVIFIATLGIMLFKLKPESVMGRITVWKVSTQMIKANPFFGIGYGNFEYQYDKYQAEYFSSGKASDGEIKEADIVRYPYNIFLQVLCEQGIIGLILFLFLIGYLVSCFIMTYRSVPTKELYFLFGISMGLIAIIISGMTCYPFDILPVSIIFFVYAGALSSFQRLNSPNSFTNSFANWALGFFFLGSSLYVIYDAYTKFTSYREFQNIVSRNDLKRLPRLYPKLSDDVDFLELYSTWLLRDGQYNAVIHLLKQSNSILNYPSFYLNLGQAYAKVGRKDLAEQAFNMACNMVPNRFLSKYFLLQFYCQSHQDKKAYNLSSRILQMPVKIPSAIIDTIKAKARFIHNKTIVVSRPAYLAK